MFYSFRVQAAQFIANRFHLVLNFIFSFHSNSVFYISNNPCSSLAESAQKNLRFQNLPTRLLSVTTLRFELYYSTQVCFLNKGHMILPALPYFRRICRWTRIVTTSLKSACSSCVIIVSDDHYTSWKSFKKPVSKHRFSSKQKLPILSARR